MKKFKINILFILISILSVCLISGCGTKYDYVKDNLNGNTFYYNGGTINSLNGLIFNDGKVTMKHVFFDGNGKHNEKDVEYEYNVDKDKITINNSDKLVIAYKIDGDTIILGDGKTYFSENDVQENLKGYWNSTESDFILGMITKNQYNVYIEDDKITYEYAALAYNSVNDYYYYGPYYGEYKLNFGEIEADTEYDGNFFFNIIDGEVTLLHFDNVCTKSDGLPGEDGYEF